jgi:hypothetical protein
MAEDNRLTVLKAMNDHYDQLFRRVHYLFVAHSAGLVGTLTILKDYASTPQYRGVGLPAGLFGAGLIAAILTYIALSFAQMVAKNSVLDRAEQEPSMFVFWVHYGGLAVSVVSFVVALLIIIWHVISL